MVPLRLEYQPESAALPQPGAEALAYLNHLRFVAMRCRARPQTELFEACALLHAGRSASRTAHAEALMRCLNQALGKRARLLAPGTAEMTFDEHWLVQLALACARGDTASQEFLLTSRVAHENRRLVRFLVVRIAEERA